MYNLAAASNLPVADESESEWLLSFADIVTLLLTLFVLLLAISHYRPDAQPTASKPEPRVKAAHAGGQPGKPEPRPQLFPFDLRAAVPKAALRPGLPAVSSAERANGNSPAVLDPRARTPTATPQREAKQATATAQETVAHNGRNKPSTGPSRLTPNGALAVPAAPAPPATAGGGTAAVKQASARPAGARKAAQGHTVAATAPAAAAPVFELPKDIRSQVEVARSASSINLIIKDDLLYPVGTAKLSAAGKRILARIADLLSHNSYPVSVEGYTDNTPIHNQRFPSNWELSAARATNVTRYLITQGVAAGRLSAVGYGDTRPRADNATAAGRARNRRVSLVVHLHTAHKDGPRPEPVPGEARLLSPAAPAAN